MFLSSMLKKIIITECIVYHKPRIKGFVKKNSDIKYPNCFTKFNMYTTAFLYMNILQNKYVFRMAII